mmetsp:Transcript_51640/g.122329  ORF Transcript_51640/g.122329 Transcript_51640/m.122329 type:complete len:231 (+) Transcript_51640:1-693(+)
MDSIGSSSAAAPAGDGAPKIMSAKQQKLFDLRMRMNEGRKLNHMEVAAEKRRATDPLGEAKRQRELNEQRNERKRKETEDAEGGGEEGMEEEAKDEKKEKKEKEAGDKVKAPRKKRAPKAGVASTDDDLALIRALAGCAGGAAPEDDAMDTDMQLLAAALAGEASAADSHDEWLPSGGGEAGDNNLAAALRECAEEDADEEEGDTGDELADPFYHYALDPAGDMLGMFEN